MPWMILFLRRTTLIFCFQYRLLYVKNILGHMMVKFGKMVFVDLAGSERLKESKATGMTMTETGNMFSILWTILFFRFERPLTLIYFNIVYFALKYFFRCHK